MAEIRLIPGFTAKSRYKGKCSITGNGQKHSVVSDPTSPLEPVVDLDTFIEYEGNLEIVLGTARQIGAVAGMVPPERATALEDEVLELTAEVAELRERLQTKTDACSALASEVHSAAAHAVAEYERGYGKGYEQACHDGDLDDLLEPS